MSKKHRKQEEGDAGRRGEGFRGNMHLNLHPVVDTKQKENVVKRLAELFQDSFDMDVIQSVAQTCQWDFGKSTEALIVLGGSTQTHPRRSRRVNSLVDSSSRHKTKSLPSTLKNHKTSGRLSDSSTQSMPNGLRPHPAYFSNDSLSSGQVWQRHYKSKPQSPGLLTMIPPSGKETKSKSGSSRSSSRASMIKDTPEARQASAVILRIEKLIQSNVKVMILMRGVPGSGKTHLAQVVVNMVAANDRGQHIFSADDYFVMLGRGTYSYDPNQVSQAHNWNQKRVSEALRRATNPVVVDNTHTQAWEMRPYVAMGVENGYLIEVLEPVTPWRTREAELARRNVHNVPREKIRQMLDRYEPGWTGEKLLNLFQLKYQHCGAAHVSPEVTGFSNSPLAQHRQHAILDQPEKPKRKKPSVAKKDRRHVPGLEINNTQEQQLEELNKLFAEYGKTIDPASRQKVIEAGVPIFEVVSRIRKLQGTVLPLPIPSIPPAITEESPMSNGDSPAATAPEISLPVLTLPPQPPPPDYLGLHRRSPTDSVEPDTMSSSNASETSDCDTDSDPEPLRRYLDDCGGHFVDGEDQWEDEEEAKSEGAVSGRTAPKSSAFVTSSQEELSIIDYQLSTPAGSSQDELSLLEFQRGSTPNASSSSSEEPKTELSTLQDSLRDVLLRSAAALPPDTGSQLMKDIASQTGGVTNVIHLKPEESIERSVDIREISTAEGSTQTQNSTIAAVEINDSLIELFRQRLTTNENAEVSSAETVEALVKSSKSPDLEEIPLPCLPDPPVMERSNSTKSKRDGPKLETIVESVLSPPETDLPPHDHHLPLLENTARKIKVLQNFDLDWSSIPLPTSIAVPEPEPPHRPTSVAVSDNFTEVEPRDFDLWRTHKYPTLLTSSRSINSPDTPLPVHSKASIAKFDKGSMTENDNVIVDGTALQYLIDVFPNESPAALADLLEKCQNNPEWAAEVMTDSNSNFSIRDSSVVEEERPIHAQLEGILADGKKTIRRRKDRKFTASDVTQQLKKEIEGSFQIGNEYYSDHVLYVKKLRGGEISADSYSPAYDQDSNAVAGALENEEFLPMPVDSEFFQQLVTRFGGPEVANKENLKGYKPMIKVPESLARTLYWLWVETLNNDVAQLQEEDDIVKTDATLAAELQEQELRERHLTEQELADQHLAQRLAQKDDELWGVKKGSSMAAVVSQNLLFERFPHIDKQAVLDVFESVGNSLDKASRTLEELHPRAVSQDCPPSPMKKETRLERPAPLIVVKDSLPRSARSDGPDNQQVLVVDPSAFRMEIQRLQQKRMEYTAKGQMEMAKKNFEVASYYFSEGRKLKEEIQMRESTSISEQNAFPMEGNSLPTTLDLHYLFTGEAVQFVDAFLDVHISKLCTNKLDLHLITGRGQRSPAGLSRIKPAIQKRLVERQLCFIEENPGMLRVTIHPNDLLSSAL